MLPTHHTTNCSESGLRHATINQCSLVACHPPRREGNARYHGTLQCTNICTEQPRRRGILVPTNSPADGANLRYLRLPPPIVDFISLLNLHSPKFKIPYSVLHTLPFASSSSSSALWQPAACDPARRFRVPTTLSDEHAFASSRHCRCSWSPNLLPAALPPSHLAAAAARDRPHNPPWSPRSFSTRIESTFSSGGESSYLLLPSCRAHIACLPRILSCVMGYCCRDQPCVCRRRFPPIPFASHQNACLCQI